MVIDLQNNKLCIRNIALQSYQVSQLKFWELKSADKNTLEYSGENVEKVLIKVLNYLQKEKIKFEVSEECSKIINELSIKENEFTKTKTLGFDFKNGVYDRKLFIEFSEFLKTHLTRKLKTHQLKSAFHLYLIHNGANFSVPGSGKTSVVLSVYEKLKEEGKVNVLFVVGPAACFGPWKNEFNETIGRKANYKILAGGNKDIRKGEYFANKDTKAELYLTTFQTLINDQAEINKFFTQKGINVFLVIDEAHYIKQLNGNWANAVLNISKHSKFRCILTGTPIPNRFSDIYNLFDFLWPENEPIESSSRTKIELLEKNNKIDDAKEILENKVGSLFYRVRKKDLGLTKPNFLDPIILSMNKYEQILYAAIEKKIRHYAMDDYLQNVDFINKLKRGRMMRLRQSVSYTKLLYKPIENYNEDILKDEKDLRYIVRDYDNLEKPSKFEYLAEKIKELQKNKEKVVIWTNFVGTIEKLENYFTQDLGLYCNSIYGKTPIEQTAISDELTREQIRDEFVNENSGLDILIANPAACAESISLHKTCHNAIYYDLTYNCAQYLQSLDRIHRVGGSETVEANYYFLQYKNSIDKDILLSLRRKAKKMYQIIDNDYEIYSLDMFDDDDELKAYDRLFGKNDKSI
jgi:SNF2 family DNA or RNA helicase